MTHDASIRTRGHEQSTPARLAPLRYHLTFPAPHTHYVNVSITVPTDGRSHVELMMAVWTPGSYLVREFERHVESVSAVTIDGQPLDLDRTRKNRWRFATRGASTIVVTYRVYGREMSVRTNWIEADFALVNGAAPDRKSTRLNSSHVSES